MQGMTLAFYLAIFWTSSVIYTDNRIFYCETTVRLNTTLGDFKCRNFVQQFL